MKNTLKMCYLYHKYIINIIEIVLSLVLNYVNSLEWDAKKHI